MVEHPSFKGMPPGEPVVGKTYRADGWQYYDLPEWLSLEMRDYFLSLFKDDKNYVILAETTKGDYWRGQMLISPEGQENMRLQALADKQRKAERYGKDH